ncbi:MAG: CBS domain-containing protein [Candidatus Bathyarchaeota archaeon]
MSSVADIMTTKVVAVAPTSTVLETQKLMADKRINRIVVVDKQNKSVGIITRKDIANLLIADKSRRSLEDINAKEVMSKGLIMVNPVASISEVAETMIKKMVSSLIVVDKGNRLRGIVTKTDVAMYIASRGAGRHKVSDFMTGNPITVKPTSSIFLPAHLMFEHKISRVVVTDNQDKPIGIVTLFDTSTIPGLFKPPKTGKEKPMFVKGIITPPYGTHLLLARDIMTANPIAVTENSDLADAAKLMVTQAISGLPVIDNVGKLAGIVTKSDLTRAVAST